ncbi:MAG: pyridoxamine 5'-phosphate oxidase family protein [Chloroflexota bacterium]|nr:MAG: pyridoxamine 5'-phosphate oxidase [Chloroflexota bacterium]
MGKFYDHINEHQRRFIEKQHVFFVATAPLSADGRVNVSPKGLDCFRVLGPNQVAYLDLIGSGNETSAHLLENGRITFMFCAFDGPPNILRLYGRGQVILPEHDNWNALIGHFPSGHAGVRQIILAQIEQVQTSCGFGVPLMNYVGDRDHLQRWAETKGEDGLAEYVREKNARSIDGLPTPISLSTSRTSS